MRVYFTLNTMTRCGGANSERDFGHSGFGADFLPGLIGERAQPGQPDEVAPTRTPSIAAQEVGREQKRQQQRRAQSHVRPDVVERVHRQDKLALR
jgi:hypothetical protein